MNTSVHDSRYANGFKAQARVVGQRIRIFTLSPLHFAPEPLWTLEASGNICSEWVASAQGLLVLQLYRAFREALGPARFI
jgi:hypothetical protein